MLFVAIGFEILVGITIAQICANRCPFGESTWTFELPPDTLTMQVGRRPLKEKDAPFVAPAERQRSTGHSLRTLGEYEAWEAAHLQLPVHVLSTDPIIRRYERFFSAADCQRIQEASSGLMRRSVVASNERGVGERIRGRTNTVAWLQHDDSEAVWAALMRVADAVGLPVRTHVACQPFVHTDAM